MTPLPFRGLIFDLDGTLVDSLADIGEAMNVTLRAHGLAEHPLPAYSRMVGEGIEKLVQRALPAACPLPFPALVDEYRAAYRALDHRHTQIYPGIEALLERLTALGVPLAVLSNKRDDFTRDLVKKRLGRFPFQDVRGERAGVPRKPDPTAALELAAALDVAPARIGFVGDTPIDMNTARNAGMTGIGVLWGFRSRDELVAAGAKHLIATPGELFSVTPG